MSDEMDVQELRELLARAVEAEPLPWTLQENLGVDEAWCDWHRIGPLDFMGGKLYSQTALVQAAINALPALLDEIERHRASAALRDGGEVEARARELLRAEFTKHGISGPFIGTACPNQAHEAAYSAIVKALSMPDGYARGISDAAAYLERRADEMGDSITAQAVARIFRDEAEAIRALTPEGPTT